jgi:hypothetical protein
MGAPLSHARARSVTSITTTACQSAKGFSNLFPWKFVFNRSVRIRTTSDRDRHPRRARCSHSPKGSAPSCMLPEPLPIQIQPSLRLLQLCGAIARAAGFSARCLTAIFFIVSV